MQARTKKYFLYTLLLAAMFLAGLFVTRSVGEKVKYLKNYVPSEFSVENINLTIDLYDDHALVINDFSVSTVPATKSPKVIKLDGANQELLSVDVDGKALTKNQYKLTKEGLIISVPSTHFKIKVTSKIEPSKNTALEGLYESDGLFLTQCEPVGFRNITYFLDRPDVMTVYTTKLIADKKYSVLLSNGDVVARGDLAGNRHFVTWHDKSKKPSYLFAAVFGDLQVKKDSFRTMSGKDVALEIYATKQDISKLNYAMYSLKDAMRWDEKVFGREYDLNTYMIVAANKFNAGAMENKGLNIFNTTFILADKDIATDWNYKTVHSAIGHEYFHNWTGNRITIRNWFQLSLKEGLTVFRDQEFNADEFDPAIQRIKDANLIRSVQFKEDNGPLSHPVLPESYISMTNFYTTTVYEKGAEVIRMMSTIFGPKTFRKSMDLYFDRYDGKAVVAEDFVKAMEDESGMDLKQFRLWYSQAGTPVVDTQGQYDAATKTYTIKCKQIYKHTDKQKHNKPFFIPIKIGFVGQNSGHPLRFKYLGNESDEVVLQLTRPEQTFIFSDVREAPLPSLLRDFSAPVKMKFPYTNQQLLWLMEHDTNDFNRWDAGQRYLLSQILAFMKVIKDGPLSKPAHEAQGLGDENASSSSVHLVHEQRSILKSTTPLASEVEFRKRSDGGVPKVEPQLVSALREILNNKKLTKEFISVALTLPSDSIVYEQLDEIDPRLVFNAKEILCAQLSKALKVDLYDMYNLLHDQLKGRPYSLTKEDMAARSLKNSCLGYLAYADEKLAEKIAQAQLKSADNLTDRLAALIVLVNSKDHAVFSKATANFYDQWKHEDLVINNWLAIQSGSDRSDTLQLVQNLMTSEAFDPTVPNKVSGLLGSFAANNDKFHSPDGSGYKLYGDFIIKLDSINPEIAAGLARAFDGWKKFEPGRRNMMSQVLAKIKSQPDISSNLREIVDAIA